MVLAQGWDPLRVEAGLRNDTANLVKAGYNVHGIVFCPQLTLEFYRPWLIMFQWSGLAPKYQLASWRTGWTRAG